MNPVIDVSGISKQFVLGGGDENDLRETFARAVTSTSRAASRLFWRAVGRGRGEQVTAGRRDSSFWALRDISFTIKQGETVGLIGRNGAGKSTLLKLLSQIIQPTKGRITLRGRVGSLLEVGTGFHPELTGRENVYLSGAILGMGRETIRRRFDEIVAFSETEKFIDTPVKRYSSGMYVRLAFAVAAHLEPEILILDEVLAVGDAAFQKKCHRKMEELRKTCSTVILVSHSMAAVRSVCDRGILLEKGRVVRDGPADEVADVYLRTGDDCAPSGLLAASDLRLTNGEARMLRVELTDLAGVPVSRLDMGQPFRVTFECDVSTDVPEGHFEVSISASDGTHVLYSTTMDGGKGPTLLGRGRHTVSVDFHTVLLPRRYSVDLGVHHLDGTTCDFVQRTLDFDVLPTSVIDNDHYRWHHVRGYVRGVTKWHSMKHGQSAAGEGCAPGMACAGPRA